MKRVKIGDSIHFLNDNTKYLIDIDGRMYKIKYIDGSYVGVLFRGGR